MRSFSRPNVVVSKCLGFDRCRYNGVTIPDAFVDQLKPYVTFHTVCPEVEIGLGAPRDPVRVVIVEGKHRLIQPSTEADLTEAMQNFVHAFLDSLENVDGFILKGRSPSCGIKDVKVYRSLGKAAPVAKSDGFFGGAVLARFPNLPVEEEGRLKNFGIREHFLTHLFTQADFRAVKATGSIGDLVRFHSDNKLLLMAYREAELRIMGRLVANPEKRPADTVLADYEQHLAKALVQPPRHNTSINVLMHALGYFSKGLSAEEKTFFLDALDRYRAGRIPLSVPVGIISAWIVRFGEPYLARQTFFAPYPEDLVSVTDSGKGRKL